MDTVNTRPLLQHSESDSDYQDDIIEEDNQIFDDHIVISPDTKTLLKPVPIDKYNLSYIIFYLLGITTLLPWNFFITAEDYWMYKFRNTTLNETQSRTDLQTNFTPYLSVASAVPNTVFLILNTFLTHRISLRTRMLGSLLVILVLFITTTVLVKIDTDSWQNEFFIFTLSSVVLMNIASAIMSGGLFGVVGKFSSVYITAVVGGQALGGIFAAVCEIVSLSLGASATNSAFVYFMVGNATVILAIAAYIVLSKAIFFKHHVNNSVEINTIPEDIISCQSISYSNILKKIWLYGYSEWMVFVITLAVYPGITVLVDSQSKGSGKWSDVYFIPVVSYLIFNTGDYIGRILAGLLQAPTRGWIVAILSTMRILFIPALLVCNAHPRHYLPIFIHSDIIYIFIVALFAISNGYIANIAMIFAPKFVESHEMETASAMMAAFLGIGLAFGSMLSLLMIHLL